jgi:hypothetical protein
VLLSDVSQTTAKSVSLYQPPAGLIDHILTRHPRTRVTKTARQRVRELPGHFWAAAVSAYAFRLKPAMVEALIARHPQLKHLVWGLHIRHGDVETMREAYDFKKIFDFDSYFRGARDLTHVLNQNPRYLFIATDSHRASEIPNVFRDVEAGTYHSKAGYAVYASKSDAWLQAVPELLLNTSRFRTEHGHIAASGAGCIQDEDRPGQGMCSIDYDNFLKYSAAFPDPKPRRLFRLIREAVEDIAMLSVRLVVFRATMSLQLSLTCSKYYLVYIFSLARLLLVKGVRTFLPWLRP